MRCCAALDSNEVTAQGRCRLQEWVCVCRAYHEKAQSSLAKRLRAAECSFDCRFLYPTQQWCGSAVPSVESQQQWCGSADVGSDERGRWGKARASMGKEKKVKKYVRRI